MKQIQKKNGKSEVKLNISRTRFLLKLCSVDHYASLPKLAGFICRSVTQTYTYSNERIFKKL